MRLKTDLRKATPKEMKLLHNMLSMQLHTTARVLFPDQPAGYVAACRELCIFLTLQIEYRRLKKRGYKSQMDLTSMEHYERAAKQSWQRLPLWARMRLEGEKR